MAEHRQRPRQFVSDCAKSVCYELAGLDVLKHRLPVNTPEDISADGEFRSDLFISSGGPGAFNQFTTGWSETPNFNSATGGIPLVAGTQYYLELDNYCLGGTGSPQCAAVNYKLAGNPDPISGSASLFTGANISASVPDVVAPIPTPVITTITLVVSGSKVIINADNGLLNAQCNVQTSTNLTQWATSASGWFDLNGNFSITNAVNPQCAEDVLSAAAAALIG